MPDILFYCRGCRQEMVVDASGEGLTLPCPGCSEPVKVPSRGDTGLIHVPEVEALKIRVAELEKALGAERKRAGQAEASLDMLGSRLEKSEKAGDHSAAEAQRGRRESETAARSAREDKEAAGRKLAQMQAEREKSERALAELTEQFDRFRQEAQQRDEEAERQLAKVRAETGTLREKSGELERQLSAALEKLAELAQLKKQLGEADAQAEYFHRNFEALQGEHAKVRDAAVKTHEVLRDTELRLKASETEREELALAVAASRQDGDLLQRNRDLAAHRDRMTVELAQAREALRRTETQLYHAMSAREGLTSMIWNLRGNIEEATAIQETMQSAIDTLEREAQEMRERATDDDAEFAAARLREMRG